MLTRAPFCVGSPPADLLRRGRCQMFEPVRRPIAATQGRAAEAPFVLDRLHSEPVHEAAHLRRLRPDVPKPDAALACFASSRDKRDQARIVRRSLSEGHEFVCHPERPPDQSRQRHQHADDQEAERACRWRPRAAGDQLLIRPGPLENRTRRGRAETTGLGPERSLELCGGDATPPIPVLRPG